MKNKIKGLKITINIAITIIATATQIKNGTTSNKNISNLNKKSDIFNLLINCFRIMFIYYCGFTTINTFMWILRWEC